MRDILTLPKPIRRRINLSGTKGRTTNQQHRHLFALYIIYLDIYNIPLTNDTIFSDSIYYKYIKLVYYYKCVYSLMPPVSSTSNVKPFCDSCSIRLVRAKAAPGITTPPLEPGPLFESGSKRQLHYCEKPKHTPVMN